jgi:hypothetical protein
MPTYHDDNFGCYEIDSEEDLEFYHQVQRESVLSAASASSCARTMPSVIPVPTKSSTASTWSTNHVRQANPTLPLRQ